MLWAHVMDNEAYKEAYKKEIQAPAGLYDAIMARIDYERKRRAMKVRFFCCLTALVPMSVAVVAAWHDLQMSMAQSGFGAYAMFLVYDFQAVLHYWREFGMSLLESLPAVHSMAILALLWAIMFTLRLAITYGKVMARPDLFAQPLAPPHSH